MSDTRDTAAGPLGSALERGVRRVVVARFPVPHKAPAVVMMPADMSHADMDMLTGMFAMLAARFRQNDDEQRFLAFWRGKLLPRVLRLCYTRTLKDGAAGRPDALRSDDCADGSIPQAPNV